VRGVRVAIVLGDGERRSRATGKTYFDFGMWTGWVVLVERIWGSETVLMGEDRGLWCRLRNSELRSIWVCRADKSEGRPPNSSGMSWQTDLRWTTRESFDFDSPLARSLPSVDEYRARGDDGKGSVWGPPNAAPSCSRLSRRRLILQLTSLVCWLDERACINRKQTTVPTSPRTRKSTTKCTWGRPPTGGILGNVVPRLLLLSLSAVNLLAFLYISVRPSQSTGASDHLSLALQSAWFIRARP